MPTDTERLNFLQKLTDRKAYTSRVILRESSTGRGWRLHETSLLGAVATVREAIDLEIKRRKAKAVIQYKKGEKIQDVDLYCADIVPGPADESIPHVDIERLRRDK